MTSCFNGASALRLRKYATMERYEQGIKRLQWGLGLAAEEVLGLG